MGGEPLGAPPSRRLRALAPDEDTLGSAGGVDGTTLLLKVSREEEQPEVVEEGVVAGPVENLSLDDDACGASHKLAWNFAFVSGSCFPLFFLLLILLILFCCLFLLCFCFCFRERKEKSGAVTVVAARRKMSSALPDGLEEASEVSEA